MPQTALQMLPQIEAEAHQHFGEQPPPKPQLESYVKQRIEAVFDPASLAIIALASLTVASAGLILQGWRYYQDLTPRCPQCNRVSIGKQDNGKEKCQMGHEW